MLSGVSDDSVEAFNLGKIFRVPLSITSGEKDPGRRVLASHFSSKLPDLLV
jgi:hypothetical protein